MCAPQAHHYATHKREPVGKRILMWLFIAAAAAYFACWGYLSYKMSTEAIPHVIDRLAIPDETARPRVSEEPQVSDIASDFLFINNKLDEATAMELAQAAFDAARRFNLDPRLIKAIIITESTATPNARSSCGARGPMQVIPKYWDKALRSVGIITADGDYYDPTLGVHAGAFVLRHYLDRFDHDEGKALAAYSGGAKNYHEKIKRRMRRIANGS